ncbi:glycosyltransferase family 10 [Oceanospirillaceae bacterium]|nr:glycosyltransferase family 10 [Oceanospirillaceae bacterium]
MKTGVAIESQTKVGIVPYELRHHKDLASITLDQLLWPGQHTDPNKYPSGCIAGLGENDYVVVYPSSTRLLRGFGKVKCKVVLLMAEPLAIQKRYYQLIWMLRYKFALILCRYGRYADKYANVIQSDGVEPWVEGENVDFTAVKTHSCSIISSGKTDLVGHKLRHQVIAWLRLRDYDVDVLGRGYKPFEHKQEGLLPYTYSVIIENVQEPDYFTEKLLDCFVCGTIPVYWGAPNISHYFNVDGMVICNDLAELQGAIEVLLRANVDSKLLVDPAIIEHNRNDALAYSNLPKRIAHTILNINRP